MATADMLAVLITADTQAAWGVPSASMDSFQLQLVVRVKVLVWDFGKDHNESYFGGKMTRDVNCVPVWVTMNVVHHCFGGPGAFFLAESHFEILVPS